jgi:hypothetical protein
MLPAKVVGCKIPASLGNSLAQLVLIMTFGDSKPE